MTEIDSAIIMKQEEEANKFAYELLMPKSFIVKDLAAMKVVDIHDNKLISQMANRYKVSYFAMAKRINDIFEKQIKTAT